MRLFLWLLPNPPVSASVGQILALVVARVTKKERKKKEIRGFIEIIRRPKEMSRVRATLHSYTSRSRAEMTLSVRLSKAFDLQSRNGALHKAARAFLD